MKGMLCFGKKDKLQPGFNGTFEILQCISNVTYQLALSPDLSIVHVIFHVSMIRKYVPHPSHVFNHQTIELEQV